MGEWKGKCNRGLGCRRTESGLQGELCLLPILIKPSLHPETCRPHLATSLHISTASLARMCVDLGVVVGPRSPDISPCKHLKITTGFLPLAATEEACTLA